MRVPCVRLSVSVRSNQQPAAVVNTMDQDAPLLDFKLFVRVADATRAELDELASLCGEHRGRALVARMAIERGLPATRAALLAMNATNPMRGKEGMPF